MFSTMGIRRYALSSLLASAGVAFLGVSCQSSPVMSQSSLSDVKATNVPASKEVVKRAVASGVEATLSGDRVQRGAVLLLAVRLPAAAGEKPVLRAEFDGLELPVYSVGEGLFEGIVGVPFDYRLGETAVKVVASTGDDESDQVLSLPFTVLEGDYGSETLKVSPRHVNPSKKDLARIKRDIEETREIYRRVTPKRYWTGKGFIYPVDSLITSPYGKKRLFNGEMQSYHQGIDMRAPTGTPIRAAGAGKVVLAKDLFFSGRTVILDHGYGLFSIYAHMSKLLVKKGQEVQAGKVVGLSGMTGRSSGPHLHFGTIIHKVKVDPVEFIKVIK